MKKIVTLFAALFSFAAVFADTETVDGVTYTYSISNGEATIVSEDCWSPAIPSSTSGELVVPSTLGGCPVMTIGSHAFYGCSSLTSVTIPEGVTTIGEEAFYICRSLTSVTIPESVTTIGGGAFMGTPFYDDQPNGFVIFGKVLYGYKGECLSLVTIPNGVMAIGGGAFRDCSSLTSVTIPESVTTIGSQAFYGCSSLAPVTIPESVTTIGSQSFEGCSLLTSVTIPSSVTTIGERAFACCEKLELVSIPSSVTEIGLNSFIGCRSLARVVVDIGDAQRMKDLMKDSGVDIDAIVFFDGSPLADGGPYTEKVNGVNYTYFISNGEAEIGTGGYSPAVPYTVSGALVIPTTLGACPVTKIGGFAFREREVTSVAIPSGVTIIGEHAFALTSLTMVTIPESVTTIGVGSFLGCSSLTSVTIPSSVTTIGDRAFASTSLTMVTIPEGVTTIGEEAFSNCRQLTSVTIPRDVRMIGAYAFDKCNSLTTVYVGNGDVSRVRELMRGKGVDVDGLAFIENELPNPDGGLYTEVVNGVEYTFSIVNGEATIGYAYDDGHRFEIAIPESTSGALVIPSTLGGCPVKRIEKIAFLGCNLLTSVAIPKGVTEIGVSAFAGCSSLISVTIPSSVMMIDSGAFEGTPFYDNQPNGCVVFGKILYRYKGECPSLVTIPDGVTEIGASAFLNCSSLKSVTIPEGVTEIGASAFVGCSSLMSVMIPGSVTEIGAFAFAGCVSLTSATIPEGVMTLGDSAFNGCSMLKSVTIPESLGSVGATPFAGTPWYELGMLKLLSSGGSGSGTADSVTVKQEVVHYVLNSVQPSFVIPAAYDTGFVNCIAEVKGGCVAIPATWTVNYPKFTEKFGSDFTKALSAKTGKIAAGGREMLVWEDYVAGTDPTDPNDKFTASMTIVDGKPVISWTPELDPDRAALRTYTTYGKVKLTDSEWTVVPEGRASDYNFFKVTVEMK